MIGRRDLWKYRKYARIFDLTLWCFRANRSISSIYYHKNILKQFFENFLFYSKLTFSVLFEPPFKLKKYIFFISSPPIQKSLCSHEYEYIKIIVSKIGININIMVFVHLHDFLQALNKFSKEYYCLLKPKRSLRFVYSGNILIVLWSTKNKFLLPHDNFTTLNHKTASCNNGQLKVGQIFISTNRKRLWGKVLNFKCEGNFINLLDFKMKS